MFQFLQNNTLFWSQTKASLDQTFQVLKADLNNNRHPPNIQFSYKPHLIISLKLGAVRREKKQNSADKKGSLKIYHTGKNTSIDRNCICVQTSNSCQSMFVCSSSVWKMIPN